MIHSFDNNTNKRPTQQWHSVWFSCYSSFFSWILNHNRVFCSISLRSLQIFRNNNVKNLTHKQSFGSSLRSHNRVRLRKVGCRGKVCQLLLAEGLDLLVLGKRYAADLGYIVCAVQGAFPRVLTSSWDDSIHLHWTSLGLLGSWLSCFGDLRLSWVPLARVALK